MTVVGPDPISCQVEPPSRDPISLRLHARESAVTDGEDWGQACSSVKVTSTAALTSRSPGSIGIGSAAVAALAWSPALRINSPEDSAPGSVSLITRPTLRPDPVAERSPPAARVIELLVDGAGRPCSPAVAVHDLVKRSTLQAGAGPQWPVRRIAEIHYERDELIVGNTEHRPR